MSDELALHQLMRHQEFLWGMRVEHENYAIKTSGGHLILLNVPNTKVGDIVSHTGGVNGAKGNLGPLYTSGVVVEKHKDGRSLVTIAGIAPVVTSGTPTLGARIHSTETAYFTANGDTDQRSFMGTVIGETEEEMPVMALNMGTMIPPTPPTISGLIKNSAVPVACAACTIRCSGNTADTSGHSHGVLTVSLSGSTLNVTLHDKIYVSAGCVHVGMEGIGQIKGVTTPTASTVRIVFDKYDASDVLINVICFGELRS